VIDRTNSFCCQQRKYEEKTSERVYAMMPDKIDELPVIKEKRSD